MPAIVVPLHWVTSDIHGAAVKARDSLKYCMLINLRGTVDVATVGRVGN